MFDESITYKRKDGEEFVIEAILTQTTDRVVYALRVWNNGIVINDPKAEYYTNSEEAVNVGFRWIKEWKTR